MTETLKSLLRPLRNILLPTPPTEPTQTPEERLVERNAARRKGFTYLKSMEEVLSWDEHGEDSLQRSSMPLLPRPKPVFLGAGEEDGKGGRAGTMVIHDFGEAYHGYEASARVVSIDERPFCLDAGELQVCEVFVYFAHYLVSCPPPGWVDWCHGNGVECLGTFIVEPQMGHEEMGKILERDEGGFVVARVLGRMAAWVGFEGWLVNIEGTFGEGDWDVELMVGFLEELRGYGVVVWYDALTTTNKLSHQNALTPLNLPFFQASSALLTNYTWTPSLISSSLSLATTHNLPPKNIFFGIDIWAQNRPRSFLHPRLTWPLFTGGGTNTGFAVKKCAEMGVSAGLFAPGWCWEHFSSPTDREKAARSLWRGVELEEGVRCDCKVGFWDGDVHRTREYLGNGVVRFAEGGVVGCEDGFWTGFERAFRVCEEGKEGECVDGKRMISQLGAQGIMPVRGEDGERDIWWGLDDDRPGVLNIIVAASSGGGECQRYLKLYNLGIRVEKDTRLLLHYRRPQPAYPQSIALLIKTHSPTGESQETIPLPPTETKNISLSQTLSNNPSHNATIKEIGILFTGTPSTEQEIIHLTSLSLGHPSSFPSTSPIRITDIDLKIQEENEWEHGRLTWHLSPLPKRPNKGSYWSRITGEIAYFEIAIDGVGIGRARGLNYVLPGSLIAKWRSDGIIVELVSVLFGGARLSAVRVRLGTDAKERTPGCEVFG